MDTEEDSEGFQCRWAGCFQMLETESDWIKHVSIHVFTLKPYERTPWLGPPELDPERQHVPAVEDEQSDGEDDDDDRAFSQINALSSPASTPPQAELPKSPDLSEKINGPSTSAFAVVEPLRLLSPGAPERPLSHRTSASADGVEADLIPTSPTPSVSASQSANSNSNQENSYPQLPPHPLPVPTQTSSFRRATFDPRSPFQAPARSMAVMGTPQSQGQLAASQTLQTPDSSQVDGRSSQDQTNGIGMSWLNTQAFHAPESQGTYDSD